MINESEIENEEKTMSNEENKSDYYEYINQNN